MIDLLRGSLGDSRYSDNDSNRYQHSQYGLLSGNYLNERNSAFEAQAELSLPSPPLRSPFELHRDATSLDPNARSHDTSGTITMSTQSILRNATEQDLFAAQNPAYMRLFTDNMKLTGRLEALEKAYHTIASTPGATPRSSAAVVQDTPPENPENYPNIDFWEKKAQLEEKAKRAEFACSGKAQSRKGRKRRNVDENVSFWHFQHPDGTVLTNDEVRPICRESKKIWRALCDRYGPIGAPWSTISPERQLDFYLKIEEKFPILQLCEHHYKAETIAFSDYSHWYDNQFPYDDNDNSEEHEESKTVSRKTLRSLSRKRSQTASPMKSRRSAKKARHASPVQDGDDKGTTSDEPEERLADADADTDEDECDENANTDSDSETNTSSSSTSKHDTPPSSVRSPPKPKPKPRPVLRQLRSTAKAPTPRQERTPVSSGVPEPPPTPPVEQSSPAVTNSSRTEAPIFNPNPLTNLSRGAPTTDTQESTSTPNDADEAPPTAPVPDLPSPNASDENGPEWTGLTQETPESSSSSNIDTTGSGSNAVASDADAGPAAGSSSIVDLRSKAKKAGLMQPGTSKTARNLFAIDYVKDHAVTREEFAKEWVNLDEETKTKYKALEEDAKKNPSKSTSA